MENRVLILAPRGRDAELACGVLKQHGLSCHICANIEDLLSHADAGAGTALVTEEALASPDVHQLKEWVATQPKWSDFPFVILGNGAKAPRSTGATSTLSTLRNLVLLERPLHAEAIVGAVRSALTARARQYEVREFALTLEQSVAERTEELENARASLEIALDAAGMGSWDLDLVSGRARRTPRHDEIFGYPSLRDDWDKDVFLSHVVPEQREDVEAAFASAEASGVLEMECCIKGGDGTSRWIAVKGRVRYDSQRTAVRMSGVVSDVTARREADARLTQAQKMDAVGQLTGGVAHDFNNLLTPIIGNLDLLRRRYKNDERGQRLVGGALQAAERAATLTQRLLAFARRQTLEPQSVDVGAIIDSMVELARPSLGPNIQVSVDVPRHLNAARVDPHQLELALLNLAINARDAMPGGGSLGFSARESFLDAENSRSLVAGHYVRIVATDTGCGMDHQTMARAVEPFFSTKGVGKGTGLGLSMVHGLAAQSGGTMHIQSNPGKGTSVELWLPISGEAGAVASVGAGEPISARKAATVLLVDDEELVRNATSDMLRDLGYTVVEASSGAQALSILRSECQIHAVTTDYLMPGMTGAALIREMRSEGIQLPVLLITGYAATGEDVPADVPRLTKPFREGDLANRLNKLLEQTGSKRGRGSHLRVVDTKGAAPDDAAFIN